MMHYRPIHLSEITDAPYTNSLSYISLVVTYCLGVINLCLQR